MLSSWRLAAPVILVVTLGASGCSGGSGKSVATATTTTSTTTGAPSNQAFFQCMQSHGVNITSLRGLRGGTTPSSLPAGVTAAQFQQALQACRSLRPAGGGNFQNNPAFAAYRNCLTLHGVTLPRRSQGTSTSGPPTSGSAPGGGPGLGGLDRTNPTVQAALQACAPLLPSGAPGGSTTTPTP